MSEQVTESITIDAPPAVVFAILAAPRQHSRIDGSGSVRLGHRTRPAHRQGRALHRADEAVRRPLRDPNRVVESERTG